MKGVIVIVNGKRKRLDTDHRSPSPSRMYAALKNQLYNWLFQLRGPEAGVIVLVQRRVFILPTRHGLIFAAVLLLMLTGSINYNLSLGFVLTFLLARVAGQRHAPHLPQSRQPARIGRPGAAGLRRRHCPLHGEPGEPRRRRPLQHRAHPRPEIVRVRRRAGARDGRRRCRHTGAAPRRPAPGPAHPVHALSARALLRVGLPRARHALHRLSAAGAARAAAAARDHQRRRGRASAARARRILPACASTTRATRRGTSPGRSPRATRGCSPSSSPAAPIPSCGSTGSTCRAGSASRKSSRSSRAGCSTRTPPASPSACAFPARRSPSATGDVQRDECLEALALLRNIGASDRRPGDPLQPAPRAVARSPGSRWWRRRTSSACRGGSSASS